MKSWQVGLLIATITLLTACGGGSSGGDNNNNNGQNNDGQNNDGNGSSVSKRPLNDTGITRSGTTSVNNNLLPCSQTSYTQPGSSVSETIRHPQDCDQGRDKSANDNSDGWAGFSFTKLDDNGDDLPASATQTTDNWECTRDNVTGLIWEVKSPYSSNQRYYDYTFTWYSTDVSLSGGDSGTANGGICSGGPVKCDTEGYVTFINQTLPGGLCGLDDGWRLPTAEELLSLHNFGSDGTNGIGTAVPAIDTDYFPHTMTGTSQTGLYWSGSTYAAGLDQAWRSNFATASGPGAVDKNIAMRVRLVHD